MNFDDESLIAERYELAAERILEVKKEHLFNKELTDYFNKVADFILMMDETYKLACDGGIANGKLDDLKILNHRLYEDILPENYEKSYANPTFACEKLGDDFGALLSGVYFEIRSMISFAFEQQTYELLIRMELFSEIYTSFLAAFKQERFPKYDEIKDIVYWYFCDYTKEERDFRFEQIVAPVKDFARDIIMNSNLDDITYLYRFGEYISDNEIESAKNLMEMSDEAIQKMADTYTEGYRIGFATCGKDISLKKTVSVRYFLGFEKMIKKAIVNFKNIGLESSVYRAIPGMFHMANTTYFNGYTGACANKQYIYDHKDDNALFMDSVYNERRLEAVRESGEKFKAEAKLFGGPAVIEVFGEKPFSPKENEKALHLSKAQEKMLSDYRVEASLIQNEYIIGKERSFTIISFPLKEIGKDYKQIFAETVKLNTLDYMLYQKMQQILIDTLDKADHVIVKGMGDNHTDMYVSLHTLSNSKEETNFENCVADVNIPVGEVFTSPLLKGTHGTLHVTGVYLEGLYFKNLELKFEDGKMTCYSCSNYESETENKKYIEDNILFHHKTLPIGEFAIGTNTEAYIMAKKYDIAGKLPILIAEKTGPHFAVGDTCYSQDEDNISCNPDGKRIIARENEISALRKTDPSKAYFNCHTDITIPYNELGELSAVTKSGEVIPLILKGRFVLEGTEIFNKPLDEFEQRR